MDLNGKAAQKLLSVLKRETNMNGDDFRLRIPVLKFFPG